MNGLSSWCKREFPKIYTEHQLSKIVLIKSLALKSLVYVGRYQIHFNVWRIEFYSNMIKDKNMWF